MNLLFLDLETTGLDPVNDRILEVGAVLVDEQLEYVSSFSGVIHLPVENLEAMPEVVRKMHKSTGLWEAVTVSPTTELDVLMNLNMWLDKHDVDGGNALLAGSGVARFDRPFLLGQCWDSVVRRLHYGEVDMSSLRRLLRLVGISALELEPSPVGKLTPHRAFDDAMHSFLEVRAVVKMLKRASATCLLAGVCFGESESRDE